MDGEICGPFYGISFGENCLPKSPHTCSYLTNPSVSVFCFTLSWLRGVCCGLGRCDHVSGGDPSWHAGVLCQGQPQQECYQVSESWYGHCRALYKPCLTTYPDMPAYSRTSIIRPSIIQLGNFLYDLLPWRHACLSSTLPHALNLHCCCEWIKVWFMYSIIIYLACLWN